MDLPRKLLADWKFRLQKTRPQIRSFCPQIRQKTIAKNLPFQSDSLRTPELPLFSRRILCRQINKILG